MQQVQYQSLKNNKFQQVSPSIGIWFGTRGSEVQILSPRPFVSNDIRTFSHKRKPPPWAALRAGRIYGPFRMAFWCDIFLPRDSMSLAENLGPDPHDFPPSE